MSLSLLKWCLTSSVKSRSPNHPRSFLLYCTSVQVRPLLADPLSRLFNLSVNSRIVPKIWKMAHICPIPKSTPAKLNDLRPISILPFPGKLLERLVLTSIKDTLLKHYDDSQFGFRPKSSTTAAVISLHESLTKFLDDPATCGAMIATYDYSKAFDRLRTDIIINRLMQCQLPKSFIQWIFSYLTNRHQHVMVGTAKSVQTKVTSGVPQGSVLGPYLYAIATATLQKRSACVHLVKYADDTTLCLPIFKNSDNAHILLEHDHILSWSRSMNLDVNASKCQNVVIRKRNFQRPFDILSQQRTNSLRVLGIWFNEAGNWSAHIDIMSRIASRRLFALRLLKSTITRENLKLVYFALVRSVIEYCAPVFVSASNSDLARIDRMQSRFHKIMCPPDCTEQCLPSLRDRRSLLAMRFLKQTMNPNHILHQYLPPRSKSGRFVLPYRRTNCRSRSFFLYMCKVYNHVTRRDDLEDF